MEWVKRRGKLFILSVSYKRVKKSMRPAQNLKGI